MNDLIPILGILVAIIIPVSVFVWLYLESKDRNRTILEISKNLEDPSKLEGIEVKPGMSKEQIYKNLVKMLKKQGITITKE